MRIILPALAILAPLVALGVEPAGAATRPWCLKTGAEGPTGGLNACSYYTLEQCRMAIGGGGDQCFRNPDLAWDRLEGRGGKQPPRR